MADQAQADLIADLQRKVEELQRKPVPAVTVRLPPSDKKLRKFNGSTADVRNWVEDCMLYTKDMNNVEAVQFINRHLEGPAREEILYQEHLKTGDPCKIFDVLKLVFGEKLDSVQLKKMVYERVQKDKEDISDFARAISSLVTRLKNVEKNTDTESVLVEVFCQNVKDKNMRRYLKQVCRVSPNILFFDLRQHAVRWLEDEGSTSTASSIEVNEVNASMEKLSRRLDEVCKVQEKILEKLDLDSVKKPVVPPSSTSDWADSVQCHYCKQFGHYKIGCPRRPRFPKKAAPENSKPQS